MRTILHIWVVSTRVQVPPEIVTPSFEDTEHVPSLLRRAQMRAMDGKLVSESSPLASELTTSGSLLSDLPEMLVPSPAEPPVVATPGPMTSSPMAEAPDSRPPVSPVAAQPTERADASDADQDRRSSNNSNNNSNISNYNTERIESPPTEIRDKDFWLKKGNPLTPSEITRRLAKADEQVVKEKTSDRSTPIVKPDRNRHRVNAVHNCGVSS